jgi:hypothetical protein
MTVYRKMVKYHLIETGRLAGHAAAGGTAAPDVSQMAQSCDGE